MASSSRWPTLHDRPTDATIPFMKRRIILILATIGLLPATAAPIAPEEVAILFNSDVPESVRLAETYRAARTIPTANLIGLPLPKQPDINRDQYQSLIRNPLREHFQTKGWWQRGQDANGIILPVQNRIRVLVTIRGVPLRITQSPKPKDSPPPPPGDPISGRDDASVDSELAYFGVEGVPDAGVLNNPFFKSETDLATAKLPYLVLTARIDAPSAATCERMIRDAITTETSGLWGPAYVDIANKFPQGDEWLNNLAKTNRDAGIPTVVDRFKDTLPKSYPMNGAALYFGWYDNHASGPLLNPAFRFRPGAVAIHIHSFSAQQLTDPTKNWSAGLLEAGAAATVGNVFEPYLHLTHHLDILQQRLLDGHTWVEAAWMAMPCTSWQGVVLGDPLYRPFLHLKGAGGERADPDNDFRAFRLAHERWGDDPDERIKQLAAATARTKSGTLAEAIGLERLAFGQSPEAAEWFRKAKSLHTDPVSQLRQDYHLIAIDRAAGRKELAITAIREAKLRHPDLPETAGLAGWLDILDPPPPPAADPTQR